MKTTELKELIEPNCKNVAIFVDLDNIYYTLTEYGLALDNPQYNVFHYMNEIYGLKKIRSMKAFADFEQLNLSLRFLQEQRVQSVHVFGNNQYEKSRKNASDIELSLEALNTYYIRKNIDTYVFVTSDSDMIPIMNQLLLLGKQVHLYSSADSSKEYLKNYSNLSINLIELLEIDVNRKKTEYWVTNVQQLFKDFYTRNPNYSKLYSHKWLSDNLQQEYHFSYQSANKLISNLIDSQHILKKEQNNFYGYVWNEEKTE